MKVSRRAARVFAGGTPEPLSPNLSTGKKGKRDYSHETKSKNFDTLNELGAFGDVFVPARRPSIRRVRRATRRNHR